MATGDANDMAARIRAVLPISWFPTSSSAGASDTPVLDGVLAGLGATWAAIYSLLSYTKLQTRIASATDFFLDLIAVDFFGASLARRSDETDSAFRVRIQNNIFAPRATRTALGRALTVLTGRPPVIFEPAYTYDTGGYGAFAQGGGGMGYCVSGGYGSLELPFQCFVTAFRPSAEGISQVAGYIEGTAVPPFAPGAVTARQAIATYLDQNGIMQVAGEGEIRPLYSGAVLTGLLLEPASSNFIPASLNFATDWSTWGAPDVIVPSSTPPSLFEAATIMEFAPSASEAGGYWSLGSPPESASYVASVWVYLPPGFSATTCLLDVNNGGSLNETQAVVDQSITGRWQRVSLLFNEQGNTTYTGFAVSGANLPAYICCWQFEPGSTATSYIPTTTGVATRDADVLSNTLPGAGGYGNGAIEFADLEMVSAQVTDSDIEATIANVLPAATIAWTQISN